MKAARLTTLFAKMSGGLRAGIAASSALSACAKIFAVLVAVGIADNDLRGATTMAVALAVVIGLLRVVSSSVRVGVECHLQRSIARGLLESDVLVEPTSQPLRSLPEPTYHTRALLTDTLPELVASLFAAVVAVPILVGRLPARAGVVGAVAVAVVMTALLAIGRMTAALQARVLDAQVGVYERVATAIEGRLELVARGAEDAALRSLEDAIGRYRRVARSGVWGGALLGRAPLALGLAAVVVLVMLDASYREAVTKSVVAQAIVLAACLPILLGVVMRGAELRRLTALIEPVLEVLEAPRRAELSRPGAPPPALPAPVSATGVTFAYAVAMTPTLRDVSFEWPAGSALVIEGPNGAGKSTLLRVLLGLRALSSGNITVGGVDLASLDLPKLRRGIGYLPQRPYLAQPEATIRSVLAEVAPDRGDEALSAALVTVRLAPAHVAREGSGALDVAIGELSAGQRQRLALARVLLQDAEIYLFDEPDANLDRAGIERVAEIVRDLVARGKMVAIAAHTPELSSMEGVHVTLAPRDA